LSRNVLFVPAADVQIGEDRIAKLEYPSAFVRNSPAFDPEVELAQVEKEEINTYFGRFVSTRRTSSIEEIRPEETINSRTINQESEPQGSSPRSAEDRRRLDPLLRLSPGRAERHGFEYFRHGTLSLYAALNTRTGDVIADSPQ
jgi:hypothetical protein